LENDGLNYRKFFRSAERFFVFKIAECLTVQLGREDVFLLTKRSIDCGAVSVKLSALLIHTDAIIHFDGDSLSALSMDQTQGVLIDYNRDDPSQAYEMAVWGSRWSLAALACSQLICS
jgi:hypothetical protein